MNLFCCRRLKHWACFNTEAENKSSKSGALAENEKSDIVCVRLGAFSSFWGNGALNAHSLESRRFYGAVLRLWSLFSCVMLFLCGRLLTCDPDRKICVNNWATSRQRCINGALIVGKSRNVLQIQTFQSFKFRPLPVWTTAPPFFHQEAPKFQSKQIKYKPFFLTRVWKTGFFLLTLSQFLFVFVFVFVFLVRFRSRSHTGWISGELDG